MKAAAQQNKTGNSSASAEQFSQRGNGIGYAPPKPFSSSPAPTAQFTLTENQTYIAVNDVNGFTTKTGKTAALVVKGQQYTVLGHVSGRTLLYDRAGSKDVYIVNKLDNSDLNDFTPVGPELATDDQTFISQYPDQVTFVDFFKANHLVPDINDVSEGNTGDCWLLGVMAAMVRSPKWIGELTKRFKLDVPKKQYSIDLSTGPSDITGKLNATTTVSVSGLLAVYTDDTTKKQELLYAQQQFGVPGKFAMSPDNTAIWPAIIEKAIAMLLGGYQALDDKEADVGFKLLGGQEPQTMKGAAVDANAWKQLKKDFDAEAAVTVTTTKNSSLGMAKKMSDDGSDLVKIGSAYKKLVEDHVYTLVAMSDTEMTLRNPHGSNHPDKLEQKDLALYVSRIDMLPGK